MKVTIQGRIVTRTEAAKCVTYLDPVTQDNVETIEIQIGGVTWVIHSPSKGGEPAGDGSLYVEIENPHLILVAPRGANLIRLRPTKESP